MPETTSDRYDVVVIGSGFGGVMICEPLVRAGARVLLLERGEWVHRTPEAADPVRGFFQLSPAYAMDPGYSVRRGRRWVREGICACVGGPSVFYGGASFRFREQDFEEAPEIVGDSEARWPFGYDELRPSYARAEALLGVAGAPDQDPTAPRRRVPYPRSPAPLAPVSARLARAARELGLRPFRIPLAFDEHGDGCVSCDGYACQSGAKNDLAATVLPKLLLAGLELRTGTVVLRILRQRGSAAGVEAYDRTLARRVEYRAERVVLAAGALASPHILLASGLVGSNPGGRVVGRYLMRHCNAFVYAFFPRPPNGTALHHKQIAINDFYFGDESSGAPAGKLGNLQQIMHPQPGGILRRPAFWLLRAGRLGEATVRMLGRAIVPLSMRMTGLQVIAEDQPRAENRVEVDRRAADRYGLPLARVHHRYTPRDLAARAALIRRASEVLNAIKGGIVVHVHAVRTFSHAVGTVRAGANPRSSALDEHCRFRGTENLYVVDGSFMPTSAAVNPSLTIAANALRVGEHIAGS